VPKIVDWYMEGKINIDDLITHKLKLADINEGFDLMHAGKVDPRGGGVLNSLSKSRCFGGVQAVYSHESRETGTNMRFGVFLPPHAEAGSVPVLYWLSGLTCTEENFIVKAGAQRVAAELGLALVVPDTSPRGLELPGEPRATTSGSALASTSTRRRRPWSRRLPDVLVCGQGAARLIESSFPVRSEEERDLRSLHGRAWRADRGAEESRSSTSRCRRSRRSRRRCAAPGARRR
jgi:S-formylglutathione hydrolase